jgi:hypothetical protein
VNCCKKGPKLGQQQKWPQVNGIVDSDLLGQNTPKKALACDVLMEFQSSDRNRRNLLIEIIAICTRRLRSLVAVPTVTIWASDIADDQALTPEHKRNKHVRNMRRGMPCFSPLVSLHRGSPKVLDRLSSRPITWHRSETVQTCEL